MILPLNAIWGGINYLLGNAQVFDGTFDYDQLTTASTFFTESEAMSLLFVFDYDSAGITTRPFGNGDFGVAGARGFGLNTAPGRTINIGFGADTSFTLATIDAPLLQVGANGVVFTKPANTVIADVKGYINGVVGTMSYFGTTIGTISPPDLGVTTIGARAVAVPDFRFRGKIKAIEIIDTELSEAQALQATVSGSFRSAGFPYSGGNYRFAVDFNKTDGNPPTTFAGTPFYTITAFGGATYLPYL